MVEVGVAVMLQPPNQNCKKDIFVEIVLSTVLCDLLLSTNKPQNPFHDQYSGNFKNKRTHVWNKIKNLRLLDFLGKLDDWERNI